MNLSGQNKARRLVETFGERGFDYIGNDQSDIHVWAVASRRMAIRTPLRTTRELASIGVEVIESPKPTLASWLRLIRVHQYSKNALIFLPLFTAHKFDLGSFLNSILAAVAFSLCASSAYIFNDLVDLSADRGHPTKKSRPLAAGDIPPFAWCHRHTDLVFLRDCAGCFRVASISRRSIVLFCSDERL